MEITWENPISSSRNHHRHPSFSSTLLDEIYRSIDDSPAVTSSITKKQLHRSNHRQISPDYHRHSIAADFDRSRKTSTVRYSNSSSSDFNGFSSSESGRSKSSASTPPPAHQPKPIRTSVEHSPAAKQELGSFLRTKTKALKIYTDLKKIKQPISPGGRLSTFLNSLFTTTNPKKQKKTSTTASSSTCSSASSYSRSCLSKTPSSTGKSKRSVRFCPVNVILDEESSTIPMPYTYGYHTNNDAKRHRHVIEEENRRIIEAAKDLIRTYQKNKDHFPVTNTNNVEEEEDDDDDDDAASYASSDLFELENLSAIGIERYGEELPVYETTRMDTNRAIATRLTV